MSKDFTLLQQKEFPDLKFTAFIYEHKIHKFPFIYLKTNDTHNFFSVSFKTISPNDSGSTHVLEHMTLNGSQKYPIPNLFTELSKISVAYDMNAGTSLDTTEYYFSSCIEKDFYSNLDVYLDAVFNPSLTQEKFDTECHRIQPTENGFKHSGVVYNEMCGVITNPEELFEEKLRSSLVPDTPYKFFFGGNPESIAKLKLEDIKDLYKKYYSPSNCIFYHYGSFDIEKILTHVSSYVNPIPPSKPLFSIDELIQKPWTEPRHFDFQGPMEPLSDPDKQIRSVVCWLIPNLDTKLKISMGIVMSLLTESVSCALYQKLVKTQIGSHFIQSSQSQANYLFPIGLAGLSESGVKKYQTILFDTLKTIAKTGFKQIEVESQLQKMEMSLKSVRAEQGARYFSRLSNMIYGVDPLVLLDLNAIIEQIRQSLEANPRYFSDLIKTYLLDNPSYAVVTVRPVKGFIENMIKQRDSDLEAIEFTPEEIKAMEEREERIRNPPPPQTDILPRLSIEDLVKPKHDKSIYNNKWTSDNLFVCTQPTNGILYITISAELPLNNELLPYYTFLSQVLCVCGAGELDDEQFALQEDLLTNGIHPSNVVKISPNDTSEASYVINVRSSFLARNTQKAMDLIKLTITDPMLTNQQEIESVIAQALSCQSSSIAEGSPFNKMAASASISRSGALEEIQEGISSLKQMAGTEPEDYGNYIREVFEKCYKHAHFTARIAGEPEDIAVLKPIAESLLEELNKNYVPEDPSTKYAQVDKIVEKFKEHPAIFYEFDSAADFCALSIKGVPYNHPLNPVLSVMSLMLTSEILTDELREKDGVYDASASYGTMSGHMSLTSYRDTCPKAVFSTFEMALKSIADNKFTDDMLSRSLFRVMAERYQPTAPKARGAFKYCYGLSSEERKVWKERMTNVTREQMVEAAQYLLKQNEKGSAILGNTVVGPIPDDFEISPLNMDIYDDAE